MFHPLSTVNVRPSCTAASVARFAELVKKIGTSATPAIRKRKNAARKKLKCIIKEQRRYAKEANLRAVALTLSFGCDADFSAKHVSRFLDQVRRSLKGRDHCVPYAWVLERASRLHYHLILWLPRGHALEKGKLARWWPWGSTWVAACESVKAWGRYICKFDSIAKLPKRARLFGCGGLDCEGQVAVARATLPQWLQALLPRDHRARRLTGEGWVDLETGQLHHSPYVWTPWGMMLATASPRACRRVV
ncbi:rolling circle replication-associated protein [Paraburkholderia madseniana]